jgi:hypothetical protein
LLYYHHYQFIIKYDMRGGDVKFHSVGSKDPYYSQQKNKKENKTK